MGHDSGATLARVKVISGDITRLDVDVIVNAANSALCGGGGVDGAIHAAAGPRLLEECRTLGRCETGRSVATGGYELPSKWVIHAVGPVWSGGGRNEAVLLCEAYASSLCAARDLGAKTVAFPAISCGAYRFPVREAAKIAVREIFAFLSTNSLPVIVSICCFETVIEREFTQAYEDLAQEL